MRLTRGSHTRSRAGDVGRMGPGASEIQSYGRTYQGAGQRPWGVSLAFWATAVIPGRLTAPGAGMARWVRVCGARGPLPARPGVVSTPGRVCFDRLPGLRLPCPVRDGRFDQASGMSLFARTKVSRVMTTIRS